jgi:glucose-6-phosphate 1-dehydrogenase
MNENNKSPAIFVLFGATGDLSQRLILPALFNLSLDGLLPEHFIVLGIGRSESSDQALADHYRQAINEFSRRPDPSDEQWRNFAQCIRYHQMDIAQQDDYQTLSHRLDELATGWQQQAERIFYLAVPPTLFVTITRRLGQAGLAEDRDHTRVVVEKPLGHDLGSFLDIDQTFSRIFEERQIFRIDHFLGKETVQNILAFRFANPIFEPIWNRRYIDHVAISVTETLGVEHRAGYYESAGALRDMVQNHMLQLLSLVAMEPPVIYDADDIREKKLDVLRALRPISHDEVVQCAARGQYGTGWIGGVEMPAYCSEPGVAADSNTETFAALKLHIDNWRWQGVPFYLRTGKRLADDVSEISIRFRDVPHNAFPTANSLEAQPARLIIQIQPQQGIVLKFMAKAPGSPLRLRPVFMHFGYEEAFNKPTPDAYETLLQDVMCGDATLFMRADQVSAAWRLLMPVIEVWQNNPALEFPNYSAGTWGPEAAETLVAADGNSWLTPTHIEHKC